MGTAMMGWYGDGMSVGMWVFMGLFWLAMIGLIVWLVVKLLPSTSAASGVPPAAARPAPESPLDILDRRFARGEVDLETYRAQRAALTEARGGER